MTIVSEGLSPPFYAQMGPSVLDENVILKNTGSGISWESLHADHSKIVNVSV